jgi:hypothetical protein
MANAKVSHFLSSNGRSAAPTPLAVVAAIVTSKHLKLMKELPSGLLGNEHYDWVQ